MPSEEQAYAPPAYYLINSLLSLPLDSDRTDEMRYLVGDQDYRLDSMLDAVDEPDSTTLFEAIAGNPYSASAFDLYLGSLPATERRDLHSFYRLLVTATVTADTLDQRVESLAKRLGELGDHDFTVWMLLRHEQTEDLATREHDTFIERANQIADPTMLQILAMARLHAKAGAFDTASEHYRLLAAKLARHGEFIDRQRIIVVGGPNQAPMDLAELAREVATTLPTEAALATAQSIVVAARRADRHEAYAAYFDAFLLRVLAHLYTPQEVLVQAAQFSATATTVSDPLGEWDAAKATELIRLHAMAGNEQRATELLRTLLASSSPTGSEAGPPEPQNQQRYELISAVRTLAELYGLRQIDLYDGTPAPLHDLILRRERPFPAASENQFPGDVAWMTAAADALLAWLDDPELDRASVLEAAFVVAWQLHERGEADHAKAVVSKLAGNITADPKRLGPQHLVMMSLRVGNALPPDLAANALAKGNLSVEQEVEVIEGVRHANDPATALATGRIADNDDKLAVMRVLAPLADDAGDSDYVADLNNRINAAEEARRDLGLDESA